MSVSPWDLTLYAGALLILFLTPGPVWLALMARSVSGGFHAAWPLAFGVAVGDILWPLLAVAGVSWIVSEVEGLMAILRWGASAIFLVMGLSLIRSSGGGLQANRALTRPGAWAGFLAGVAAILGNPKAILFYMGVLPGFFDLTQVTRTDLAAIVALSFLVPLIGNLAFAAGIDRVRELVSSPRALQHMNRSAGALLIAVALVIPLT
ncbi:MAG: LysE family translocator [Rhodobacteraceae bacterium]|nr:LysE family translocator [Paracoccaceae bacterium]